MTTPANIGLRTRNDTILQRAEPFLVATPSNAAHFDRSPFGLTITDENLIDPTRLDAQAFLDRLSALDGLTFGPEGMPMPRWIFYSGAEIPGAIFGFAFRAGQLPPETRECLAPGSDVDALVPLSMYIAVPAFPVDRWFGHNLASISPQVPDLNLHGLASITKAVALKALRCQLQLGATQWDSTALHIHARFGMLELLTAWTPAHLYPATLTYRVSITDDVLHAALGDPGIELPRRATDLEVEINDEGTQRDLQRRIEAGERFAISDRPRLDPAGGTFVPVCRLD
ncbi:MAG: hypothetical protein ACYTF9_07460 [Planctomycetota bacterium]|jgi:hypothetical protein